MRILLLIIMMAFSQNLLTALPNKSNLQHKLEPGVMEYGIALAPHKGVINYKALESINYDLNSQVEKTKPSTISLGFLLLFIAMFSVFLLRIAVEMETIASRYPTYWTF